MKEIILVITNNVLDISETIHPCPFQKKTQFLNLLKRYTQEFTQ